MFAKLLNQPEIQVCCQNTALHCRKLAARAEALTLPAGSGHQYNISLLGSIINPKVAVVICLFLCRAELSTCCLFTEQDFFSGFSRFTLLTIEVPACLIIFP